MKHDREERKREREEKEKREWEELKLEREKQKREKDEEFFEKLLAFKQSTEESKRNRKLHGGLVSSPLNSSLVFLKTCNLQ